MLAYDDVAPWLRPFLVGVFEVERAYFQAVVDGFPLANVCDLTLNRCSNGNGQDVRIAVVFEVFYEIDPIETAIAQDVVYRKVVVQTLDALFEKTRGTPAPKTRFLVGSRD